MGITYDNLGHVERRVFLLHICSKKPLLSMWPIYVSRIKIVDLYNCLSLLCHKMLQNQREDVDMVRHYLMQFVYL